MATGDNAAEDLRRSERQITMTEKGKSYSFEILENKRQKCISALNKLSKQLRALLDESKDTSLVKSAHSEWLTLYDELLSIHEDCQSLIPPSDKEVDENEFQEINGNYIKLKESAVEWFSKHLQTSPSVGCGSISSSCASSHLSIAKLKESQRKVELLARASALAERKKIEEQKLVLKLKEEEFEIKTELEISDAKSKVLEEFERGEHRDDQLQQFVDNNVEPYFKDSPVVQEPKRLNPYAAEWVNVPSTHMHGVGNYQQSPPQIPKAAHVTSNKFDLPIYAGAPVARELNKPKSEIKKFDGNPMEYNRFLRQFSVRVEANTDSFEERLNYLMQFTTGEAHRIVLGYSHLDSRVGYNAALQEFKDRYGDPDVVAHTYVKKALEWPIVKPDDAKALDEYAIFLRECQYAIDSVESAKVLEYSENLKLLVRKLPYHLHEKWRNVVYEIKERKQVVKFQHLVNFVRKEAKKAVDPVYGKEVMSISSTVKRLNENQAGKAQKLSGMRKSLATMADESSKPNEETAKVHHSIAFKKPCLYCKGSSHSLDICKSVIKQALKDRYAFLKSKGLCFSCLRTGHMRGSCRQKLVCIHCKKHHPSMLHLDPRQNAGNNPVSEELNNEQSESATSSATGAGVSAHQALPIVPVRLKSKSSDNYIETYAFLDSGSNATFCLEDVMHALNIVGKKTELNLTTMAHETVQHCFLVSGLQVCSINGENVLDLPPVITQPTLPVSRREIISPDDLQRWSHLRDVPLQWINGDVGLLIGVNVPKAMKPWEVVPSVENGPFAVKTLLGWVVNGPLNGTVVSDVSCGFVTVNRINAKTTSLEEQIQSQFNHDFNERTIDDVLEPSREDKKFLDIVTSSAQLKDGHHVISLPFKTESVSMPNNRKQAEQRLISLAKRFDRDDAFRCEYINFMDKVINEDYARKVPLAEIKQNEGDVWYLPHHGVYHPRKGKLRVVFDCAARFQGTSLNDQLLQGPNLTNTLVGTLIRFRQEEIAIMGDIESMFYQVRVPIPDANFLRFLWWENGDYSKSPVEYQMVAHLFGATSSPSCANFALRKTAEDNAEHFETEVTETVLRNFYVDDCLKSVKTVNNAVLLVKNLQDLLKQGGFRIVKWISNNKEVMNSIPVSERAKEVQDLDLDQDALPIERALGVQWCVESDVFCFKITVKEQPLTRRGILSMVSSVYDPLGFLAPFMLNAKRILQELCKLQIGWDERIPDTLSNRWHVWLKELHKLSDFKIDRCVKPKGFGVACSAELHHFADASEIGYGMVTYLRLENSHGDVHCSFIIGISRVTPLKQTTIPRLELTAATVAVRTDKMVKNELDFEINRTLFWTDSMAVLRYIRNSTSRFHTFVANRLVIIHEGSEPTDWRYVNTKLNPADLASRGVSADVLIHERKWIDAPHFLWESEEEWPTIPSEVFEKNPCDDPEVRKGTVCTNVVSKVITKVDEQGVDKLINHHSSWFALKRSVAWIIKVRRELLRRIRHKGTECSRDRDSRKGTCELGRVSVQDMADAEDAILKFVQKQMFPMEIDKLNKGYTHVKRDSHIRKLDPVMDAGLLRVGGRLVKSSMPTESKHHVILPGKHHVSTLVLRQVHHNLQHSGRNHMLSYLRQRYWLLNAPTAIRKLISKCVICRRQRSQVGEQKMANLPEGRITPDEPPFTRVGVDYFGPFEVKQRRCHVKRYGVIFTCLASRAVHLEVAASLDTDAYINALCRFIARRGQVMKMRSDNGTNFVGAEKELKCAINDWNVSQIQDSMLQRNIDWQFNPPAGSHHGGVWERLIRTVRKVMNSVIREQTLDDERLHTLMCEIEATINSRPITRNSDQPNDLEALTPNHLLLLKRKPNLPPGTFVHTDNYCRRRWRQVQYMANLFWHRWVREYLPLLQERQKWHEEKRNLQVGDVVLIVDSNAPRNSWPLGVILETIPDKSGFVRQVKVKTATSTLIRPIDKLCLFLEMD